MKTKMIFILVSIVSLLTYGQYDTTTIQWNKAKILIISSKNDTIKLFDEKENRVKKTTKPKKYNGKWAGIELGLNGFTTQSGSFSLPNQWNYLDLNTPKSVNFNLNLFEQSIPIIKNRAGIVTGLGFAWNRYRFNKQTVLIGTTDELSYQYDSLIKKTQLNITYLRIPLLLEFHVPIKQSNDKIYFSGGVIGSLRIKSYCKYVYFPSSDKKVFKDNNDFYLIPFNYSFEFRMGINNIGVYFNYMPLSLFKEGKAPEVYPWAAGISLAF